MCSDAKCPFSSATKEDRRNRADIAASFQRVTVLHLEEKCERAIDLAMKLEPSIKHMVVPGGVASNQYVRFRLNNIVENKNLKLTIRSQDVLSQVVLW
ncbi:hypothetical protein Bca52824_049555 [Brassica carinata]|uniref:Gcp-like domain-containing protein n=1 Tax=Brassica carinata TaxID=52824 RepID=A0A8X7UU91_BRACI|nr:hypothetical protein Bca52824_049555 [Brassica carinata]